MAEIARVHPNDAVRSGVRRDTDAFVRYVAGGVSHGYLLIAGQFSTIDFPGATFTGAAAINQRRDILGRYRNADGVTHGFLLTGFQPPCVTGDSTSGTSVQLTQEQARAMATSRPSLNWPARVDMR